MFDLFEYILATQRTITLSFSKAFVSTSSSTVSTTHSETKGLSNKVNPVFSMESSIVKERIAGNFN